MTTRPSPAGSGVDEPDLRITGPGDLVQLVPYLLGFHPAESLVILGLARHRVVVTVRMDLADVVVDGVLSGTVSAMADGGAEELVGAVFDDRAVPAGARPPDPLPWHGVPAALEAEAARIGAVVADVLLVSGRRWWSYCCPDARCCPPQGHPLDDTSSKVPAAAAYAGLVALPDRDALAAVLAPEPAELRDPLLPRLDAAVAELRTAADGRRAQRAVKRALFAAARAADRPGSGVPADEADLIRFGAALATTAVRDAAWLAVDEQRLDGRDLWRWLGRRLPGHYAATPLFMFGWASWRAGNGALAGIAADRVLAVDPDYTAADLLLAVLSHGVDPRRMPKLRQRPA
jgi:uncharacterized protein DUF4192